MLIGRAAEWAGIQAAVQSARDSEGRVVLIRGEAGVGKTALLDQAAAEPGFRVLRAVGVEAESDLAYATAHQLLYPLLPLLDELPDAQASAVRVALGLASGTTPDRFLVALGFLSLVSEAARREPVLLALDDAQWWDAASLDAIVFVGRRIAAEPVLLLLSARDTPGEQDGALASIAGMAGVRELRVGGLAEANVAALVSEVVGVAPPEPVSQVLAERTHGNPLALVELARALTPDQIAGRDPLPETFPLGERLERPFLERAARLPSAAKDLLLVASAEPTGDLDVLAAAAGVDGVDRILEELESAGLVRYDGRRLVFCHPIARSAVYGDASSRSRHVAHLRLAEAIHARGDEDRAVWHRAAAALGIDEEVAAALEHMAERSQQRSGYASAAAAYERAAELSATGEDRTRRLIAAADAAWLAGQPTRARLLVERAEPLARDTASRARLIHMRARAASRSGDVEAAHRQFLAGAALLRDDHHPGRALELLAEAVEAASYAGDRARLAEIAEAAADLPPGDSVRERFLAAWLTVSDLALRGAASGDTESLRADLALADQLADPRLTVWAGIGALNLGDPGGMQRYYARALEQARTAGAVGSLPYALEHASMSLAFAGSYAACKSSAEEGLRLAQETDQLRSAGQLLAILAFVAATRGEEEECLQRATEARQVSVPLGLGLTNATVTWAEARLDLGLGRYGQAVDRLTGLASAKPGAGHPVISLWSTPDLVEAAVRARRTAEVSDLVAAVVALAGTSRQPGASATAAWVRGLLGGRGAADDLAAAAQGLSSTGFPIAAARARLALGELLRRERQPRAAREHLRMALDAFHTLGAEIWTERASAELRASGDGTPSVETNGMERLTAQELQIVRYVSQGASNREIAAQLFISPRTVEYHLYKAYPKLGISSRTQLISQFAGELAAMAPA